MVRSLIRNQMPRKGLRVRVPCPPLAAPLVTIELRYYDSFISCAVHQRFHIVR